VVKKKKKPKAKKPINNLRKKMSIICDKEGNFEKPRDG